MAIYPNPVQDARKWLRENGYRITESIGPFCPFGMYRINDGPELTEMQFLQVAAEIRQEHEGRAVYPS